MKWPMAPLRDLVRLQSGGTPSKQNPDYWGGTIPWVSSKEMAHPFIDDTELRLTESGSQSGTRMVPEHTVLIVVRGMSLAKEFRVAITTREMAFNQDLKAVLPRENTSSRFLFYALRAYADEIRGASTEASHGTKKLETEVFLQFRVPAPPIPEQKRIAAVLSAYDDLIENNRRRMALLEEAARHLYREWFVRLRFPGHETRPKKNGVPDGWERRSFSELAEFLNGFAFKPAHFEGEGLPIIKIPELRNGVSPNTPRNSGDGIPRKYRIERGDLLFSWSGTLLVNLWNSEPGFLNQHLFKVIPNENIPLAFLFLALVEALPVFDNETTGATMKHIRRGALDKVRTLLPDGGLMERFERVVTPLVIQRVSLAQQNALLAEARDHLLPRLMRGEFAL